MNREPNPIIVTIGEVVWDIFPDRQVLGGAPVNVAYHLAKLKEDVLPVTRIGRDKLGDETLDRMAELGLPVAGVQRDPQLATGTVRVNIDADNEPSFDIVEPAAWDAIEVEGATGGIAGKAFQLVYGTLGQRNEVSRRTIRDLWQMASFRYYDVNLRPPFTGSDLVLDSLAGADLVKVNDNELRIIGEWLGLKKRTMAELAGELRRRFDLTALAVTRGADGAMLAAADGLYEDAGIAVTVADTVGAGDAFFAALIVGFRAGLPWRRVLSLATARGSYVASCHGATPPMPDEPVA